MAFEGWIIKFGNEKLPANYLAPSSYWVSPEKRTILDEYDDNNGTGYRDVASKKKAQVRFSTKMGLHQKDIEAIQEIVKSGLVNEISGMYHISFWNPHSSKYDEADAWMEDVEYPMRKVDPKNKDIIYDSIQFELNGK